MLHLWDLGSHSIVDHAQRRSFAAHTRFSHVTMPQTYRLLPLMLRDTPCSETSADTFPVTITTAGNSCFAAAWLVELLRLLSECTPARAWRSGAVGTTA